MGFNRKKWLVCFFTLMAGFQARATTNSCQNLEKVSWLLGAWQAQTGKHTTKESWRRVSSDTYEGQGVTSVNNTDNVKSSETMRLVEMSGEVFYLAKVKSNVLPIAFKLVACEQSLAEFSNPEHDFPQKLIYQLMETNKLSVVVSGENGASFTLNFTKIESS